MHWLLLLLTAFETFYAVVATKFLGEFYAKVDSIQDYNDIPRDKIDWKIYINKSGRMSQEIAGYMFIKEKVGPLALILHIEKYAEGAGYKNFMINGMNIPNVCTDEMYERVMRNYNGTMTPDCIFEPQNKYLSPINLDAEIHRYVNETLYGKFRVGMRFHVDNVLVMGFQVIIIFEDKELINKPNKKKGHFKTNQG